MPAAAASSRADVVRWRLKAHGLAWPGLTDAADVGIDGDDDDLIAVLPGYP